MPLAAPGQIWRDDCYYLNRQTRECQRKFLLVLAIDAASDDAGTAVFTSKPNGLTEQPACASGPPRAGYFVGTPGGVLKMPTWVDFSSLDTLDAADLHLHVRNGRKTLLNQTLLKTDFCAVLRCSLGSVVVMMSLEDFRSCEETAYLLNSPADALWSSCAPAEGPGRRGKAARQRRFVRHAAVAVADWTEPDG